MTDTDRVRRAGVARESARQLKNLHKKRANDLQARYDALLAENAELRKAVEENFGQSYLDVLRERDALLEEAAGLWKALTEVLLALGSDNPLPRMPGDPGPTYCPCCDSTSAHWVTCPTAKARDVLANLSPALRAKMEETDGAVS